MRQPGLENALVLEPTPRIDVRIIVKGDTSVVGVPELYKAIECLFVLVIEQGLEDFRQPNNVKKNERLVANEGPIELPACTVCVDMIKKCWS